MTDRLDEIRERCSKTMPGPWVVEEMTSHKARKGADKYYKVVEAEHTLDQIAHYIPTPSTDDFIAHAPEDIQYLLHILTVTRNHDELVSKDRDRWKTRAEALERAIKKESLPGVLCRMCSLTECDKCKYGSDWRFDESRFSAGKEGEK